MSGRAGEAFDRLVREAGGFNPFTDDGWDTLRRCFDESMATIDGAAASAPRRLLEVGCGTGESRRILGAHAARYLGIDLSIEALRLARRCAPAAAGARPPAPTPPMAGPPGARGRLHPPR